jgi:hypothetical protein
MLTQEFPSICRGIDLLRAMEVHPDFGAGTMPILTSTFLSRIENLDPADPNLSEDDTRSSWGHYQFTSRSMRIKSVIQSWECVGSTAIACKLIAAALKTCKVAHHICFEQKINATSFLADAYLSNLIDELYDMWVKAGGISLTTIFATVLTIMVVKPMLTTGPTVGGVDVCEHDHPHMPPGPPPSPTVPPSSPLSSTFVDSLKDSSAYSVLSISPLDAKTASSSGVAGTAMDVDLPVGRTVSGSKQATNMTGRGARVERGTVGTDTACGGTTGQGTIGEVIMQTGKGSTTGDLLGTGLGHQGGLACGSTTDTTQSLMAGIKRSTAGVKPQTGLHVSA